MEKKQRIEKMYFEDKKNLSSIAKELNLSVSYVSRILKQNKHYDEEKEARKAEKLTNRRKVQKQMIEKLRKNPEYKERIRNERIKRSRERELEYQILKNMHKQASIEMSTSRNIGNNALRKWCSLYNYNKNKNCYEFDLNLVDKPYSYPRFIKA